MGFPFATLYMTWWHLPPKNIQSCKSLWCSFQKLPRDLAETSQRPPRDLWETSLPEPLPESSQMIPAGARWSQMRPDDPIWAQMLPDDPGWSQVIPDEMPLQMSSSSCLLLDATSQITFKVCLGSHFGVITFLRKNLRKQPRQPHGGLLVKSEWVPYFSKSKT